MFCQPDIVLSLLISTCLFYVIEKISLSSSYFLLLIICGEYKSIMTVYQYVLPSTFSFLQLHGTYAQHLCKSSNQILHYMCFGLDLNLKHEIFKKLRSLGSTYLFSQTLLQAFAIRSSKWIKPFFTSSHPQIGPSSSLFSHTFSFTLFYEAMILIIVGQSRIRNSKSYSRWNSKNDVQQFILHT